VRLLLEEVSTGDVQAQGTIYFRCADITLTVRELSGKGVTFDSKPHDHDLWMAFFKDPEGHTLAWMQEAPKGYSPPA
jgi:methylmalonyl-CoA/ethylmalonyl-CoA epimerase